MKGLGLALTALLLGMCAALAFDLDDLLMADAANDRVIAIVYTPHVSPGETVTVRLTLRTGTKSRVSTIAAAHGDRPLEIRPLGGRFGPYARSGSRDYEAFVDVKLPDDLAPTDRYDVMFGVNFRPPEGNDVPPFAEIAVPVRVRSAAAASRARTVSALWGVGSLALAFALAVLVGRALRRRFVQYAHQDDNELALWSLGCGVVMHGFLGAWVFAMPWAAATGRVDTWLFALLIGIWVAFSVAVGWIAYKRTAPAAATEDALSRVEIVAPPRPGRTCSVSELRGLLADEHRDARVVEQTRAVRIERDGHRVWIEYRDAQRLSLADIRLAEEPTGSLLLDVAHVLSRALGPFELSQGGVRVAVAPDMPIDELRMRWAKAMMARIEAMGTVLESLGRAMSDAGRRE